MRLVIDCFKLVKGLGKSIGIYNVAQGIVKHLGERKNAYGFEEVELVVLGNKENRDDFETDGIKFVEIESFNPRNRLHVILWELIIVSIVCKKLKADRVFFPRGYSPVIHTTYDIILIHDLIPYYYHEYFPRYFNRIENRYIMSRLKQSAKGSKKIITISQASKQEIIKYCKIPEHQIDVIYNACERIYANKDNNNMQYICAMTSDLPHKNANGVIESYLEYCEISERPINIIIIGLENTQRFDIPKEIRERITCYKFIKSDDEMYRIIGNSTVFLFLPLVEGFGLPPIEAMLMGVPVVCSDVSSLPEVVGDAAIRVNPKNPKSVAYAMNEIVSDTKVQAMLTERGKRNAERFSWNSRSELYWNVLCE